MLADKPVLIVQDNIYLALDLAEAVEQFDGRVVGPAGNHWEALALLEKEHVAAALIDADLAGDVALIVLALSEKCIPYVIQTTGIVAPEIVTIGPTAPVLVKPIQSLDAVSILAHQLLRRELS